MEGPDTIDIFVLFLYVPLGNIMCLHYINVFSLYILLFFLFFLLNTLYYNEHLFSISPFEIFHRLDHLLLHRNNYTYLRKKLQSLFQYLYIYLGFYIYFFDFSMFVSRFSTTHKFYKIISVFQY